MPIPVYFSETAAREVRKSFGWYEKQMTGLGERFVDVVDKTIGFIVMNPEGYPEKHPPFREIRMDKFPFVIIYDYNKESLQIDILRVFHTHRNPKLK